MFRPAFSRVLSSALHLVIHENSVQAWTKLLLLPKCCLPSMQCTGHRHKGVDIVSLCDLWDKGQYGVLWHMATKCHSLACSSKSPTKQHQLNLSSAIAFAREGLFSKACQALTSLGLAPDTPDTWALLQAKHPEGPIPVPPPSSEEPAALPSDFDILSILRSFPKGTTAGPSGMRIQHLIDAFSVPLPTPISCSLRLIINLHTAGKVPMEVSHFLAGATLMALPKIKPNALLDVRPIAIGEVLRRLTGKCLCHLCHLLKNRAADFFLPHQFGVACPSGVEKVIHKVRKCVNEYWTDESFVLLKVDLNYEHL